MPRFITCLTITLLAYFALPSGAETLTGRAVTTSGQPVGWTTVGLTTKNHWLSFQNGTWRDHRSYYFSAQTDRAGHFTLPSPGSEDYKLFVLHSSGFAQVSKSEFEAQDGVITLAKWARIEGTAKPGKALSVSLRLREEGCTVDSHRVLFNYTSTSSINGKFLYEVPPGKATAYFHITWGERSDGSMSSYSYKESVDLVSGETVSLNLDTGGRTIVGKLTVPDGYVGTPNWGYCVVTCNPPMEEQPDQSEKIREKLRELQEEFEKAIHELLKMRPENIIKPEIVTDEVEEENRQRLAEEWSRSDDGRKLSSLMSSLIRTYLMRNNEIVMQNVNEYKFVSGRRTCVAAPDGTFRLEDVPAGDWTLDIKLYDPPPPGPFCGRLGLLGSTSVRITVPDEESDEPLDVGILALEKALPGEGLIAVGADAPDFELNRLGVETEETIKLSDYRGKMVVLEFWATWCGPCLAQVPELVKFHERIKDNPNVVLLGISIDQDERALLNFLARRENMVWTQLRTDPHSLLTHQYGIFAVPAMVVVGPDGKVIAVNPGLSVLPRMVDALNTQ